MTRLCYFDFDCLVCLSETDREICNVTNTGFCFKKVCIWRYGVCTVYQLTEAGRRRWGLGSVWECSCIKRLSIRFSVKMALLFLPHSILLYATPMDQIFIKTPNPKCRPYWCLIEFIAGDTVSHVGIFRPALWSIAPLTFFLVSSPFSLYE